MTPKLPITAWFAIALATTVALIYCRAWLYRAFRRSRFLVRFISSYVLIRRRRWFNTSLTVLQILLCLAYLVVNGLCILLYSKWNSKWNFPEIARRCGIMASINMVPLFTAGRPSIVVTLLGLPLHVHHLLHYWMGLVSISLGILHLVFVYFSGAIEGHPTTSGALTIAGLGCILGLSLTPLRLWKYEIFLKSHHFLGVLSVGGLLWHVIIAKGLDFWPLSLPLTSIFFWAVGLILFLHNLRIRSQEVEISKFHRVRDIGSFSCREADVVRIEIKLRSPETVRPGQFVYLRFRDFYFSDKIQTHPFMISWWESALDSPKAQSLTLLVQPVNGLTRRLSSKTFLQDVSFDGPLGLNLHLESYDNVFLAVKGIGIAGVLSYAKHLIELETYIKGPRITPRKVDLYWELEDNSQEEWAGPLLRKLQIKNDALKVRLLQLWCYFPSNQTREPFVELYYPNGVPREDFQYFYPDSKCFYKIEDAIKEVAKFSSGRSIVVACGVSKFVDQVRKKTRNAMSPAGILDFVETEYRPRSEPPKQLAKWPHRPTISGPIPTTEKDMSKSKRVTFI
ncbi:hypothetical protein L207DRAFT_632111 [Hyaloscypha variabilis F]|uniref:FAD-binding FR-type domain-containing protein n=1 Tax=Hyaloscypha variabilis (strain UAMH 11265 / GT02V1 / F) TaxID=1149755 RepID=A0A2J6RUZ0_HYAVF|nr:hypothetical protein L207DRAFT_632111 [Hyaloscypha variabilis F]